MLVAGPVVGLVSGTLSYWLQYWIDPTIVTRPIGWYSSVIIFNVLAWTSWLAFVPLIWRLGSAVRITRYRLVQPALFHLGASLVLAAPVCFIAALEQYALFTATGVTTSSGEPVLFSAIAKRIFLYTYEWKVLLYWGIVGIHHAIAYAGEARQREVREARLEAGLVEARLDALQRQLHPHFVFNTLNAITSVVHRDPDTAEAMLVRLGDLLRAVFRSQAQQEVTLEREIELLQQYLDIQRVRFGASLRSEIEVLPHLRDMLVPVLLLQPLVENSIKHGFSLRTDGALIRVSAREVGDRLELTVFDNGRGASADDLHHLNEGVGLSNTRARLEHLYPGHHSVTVASPAAGGFAVTVSLPAQTPNAGTVGDILEIPA